MFKVKCKSCGEKNDRHDIYCYCCGDHLHDQNHLEKKNPLSINKRATSNEKLDHSYKSSYASSEIAFEDDYINNTEDIQYNQSTDEDLYKGKPAQFIDDGTLSETQISKLLMQVADDKILILKKMNLKKKIYQSKYIIRKNNKATQEETCIQFQLLDVSKDKTFDIPLLCNLKSLSDAINIRQYATAYDNTCLVYVNKTYFIYDIDKDIFRKTSPEKEALPKIYKDISIIFDSYGWEDELRLKMNISIYNTLGKHTKTKDICTLYKENFIEDISNASLVTDEEDEFFDFYHGVTPSEVYFNKLLSNVTNTQSLTLKNINSGKSDYMIKRTSTALEKLTHMPFQIIDINQDKIFDMPILCQLNHLDKAINLRVYKKSEDRTSFIHFNNQYFSYDFDDDTFVEIQPDQVILPKAYKDIFISNECIIWDNEIRLKMSLVINTSDGQRQTLKKSYKVEKDA